MFPRKIVAIFCALFVSVSAIACAELDLSKLDTNHQQVAKYFGYSIFPSNPEYTESWTPIITYQEIDEFEVTTRINGPRVLSHCAWYADGYVITQMSGDDEGKQIVVHNGDIIGRSYHPRSSHGHSSHKYFWGTIGTQPHRQSIILK